MPASVKGFVCQPNQWTEISSGFKSNQIRLSSNTWGYLAFGDSPPEKSPSESLDWLPISSDTSESFGFNDTSTKVFFYPGSGQPTSVKVISE